MAKGKVLEEGRWQRQWEDWGGEAGGGRAGGLHDYGKSWGKMHNWREGQGRGMTGTSAGGKGCAQSPGWSSQERE